MRHELPLDLLVCPDCRSPLAERDQALVCTCGASFAISDGVPNLIGKKSQLNHSEVETQDRVSDYYANVRYNRAWSIKYHEDTMQQLVELAEPRGTVLDDGCGVGAFIEFARRNEAHRDVRFVGVDVSRGMLTHGRRQLGDEAILVQADACRLPFPDATFDVVYARALLHHLPTPEDGVREIHRVLKPGGTAVILDPNKTALSTLPRKIANRTEHFDDDHKNFHVDELERIVNSALSVRERRFFGYIAYPLLGFPDLIDFGQRLPMNRIADGLIALDRFLAGVPGIRKFGWGVMLAAGR